MLQRYIVDENAYRYNHVQQSTATRTECANTSESWQRTPQLVHNTQHCSTYLKFTPKSQICLG
jgi:hypothetical protein